MRALALALLLVPWPAIAVPYLVYNGRGGVAIYNPDPVGYHCWVKFKRGGDRAGILWPGGQTVWYINGSILDWGCSRG